jgi:hypothetical protein
VPATKERRLWAVGAHLSKSPPCAMGLVTCAKQTTQCPLVVLKAEGLPSRSQAPITGAPARSPTRSGDRARPSSTSRAVSPMSARVRPPPHVAEKRCVRRLGEYRTMRAKYGPIGVISPADVTPTSSRAGRKKLTPAHLASARFWRDPGYPIGAWSAGITADRPGDSEPRSQPAEQCGEF